MTFSKTDSTGEKTIADCFKFRNKIGTDVDLEELREQLKCPSGIVDRLILSARIDRVQTLISHYLEALL